LNRSPGAPLKEVSGVRICLKAELRTRVGDVCHLDGP
jgi:hypothetical protein